jgi:hypothetical protein
MSPQELGYAPEIAGILDFEQRSVDWWFTVRSQVSRIRTRVPDFDALAKIWVLVPQVVGPNEVRFEPLRLDYIRSEERFVKNKDGRPVPAENVDVHSLPFPEPTAEVKQKEPHWRQVQFDALYQEGVAYGIELNGRRILWLQPPNGNHKPASDLFVYRNARGEPVFTPASGIGP